LTSWRVESAEAKAAAAPNRARIARAHRLAQAGRSARALKGADRRRLPQNAKVMQRHGRLGARMRPALPLVVRVVPPQPAVLLLVVVLRLVFVPPLPVALPQPVEPRALAVLPLAVRRPHAPQRADGRPPLAVRRERLGPTRTRRRL
jgi:hypothetical protein